MTNIPQVQLELKFNIVSVANFIALIGLLGTAISSYYSFTSSVDETQKSIKGIVAKVAESIAERKAETIALKEIKLNESTKQPCLKQDGTDQNNSNITLSNPFILMFKPWMLAVKEGWIWKVELRSNYGPVNTTIERIEMRYTGTETYLNRTAYIVEITKNGNTEDKITSWIDKEKRVLLKENGMAYTIEIKEAPFLDYG